MKKIIYVLFFSICFFLFQNQCVVSPSSLCVTNINGINDILQNFSHLNAALGGICADKTKTTVLGQSAKVVARSSSQAHVIGITPTGLTLDAFLSQVPELNVLQTSVADLVEIANLNFIIADANDSKPMFDVPVLAGINLVGKITLKPGTFLSQWLDKFLGMYPKIEDMIIDINIPIGTTQISALTSVGVFFYLTNPLKQFCVRYGVRSQIAGMKIKVPLSNALNTMLLDTCFKSENFGLTLDQNKSRVFYVNGSSIEDFDGMLKIRTPLPAQVGQREAVSEGGLDRVTIGLGLPEFSFSQLGIDGLDQFCDFSNIFLSFNNDSVYGDTLFDIDNATGQISGTGVAITYGITLLADVQFKGTLSFLGAFKLKIYIPPDSTSVKSRREEGEGKGKPESQVTIKFTTDDNKPRTIDLGKLFKKVAGVEIPGGLIFSLTNFGVLPFKGNIALDLIGTSYFMGSESALELVIGKSSMPNKKLCFFLSATPSSNVNMGKDISLYGAQLIVASEPTETDLFAASSTIDKGLQLFATATFGGTFGKILNFFDANGLNMQATVPVRSKRWNINATKLLNKSLGKDITFQSLSIDVATEPISFGIAVETLFKNLVIQLGVSLDKEAAEKGEYALTGEIQCEAGTQCKILKKPFNVPITLAALPPSDKFLQGLPLSLGIDFTGASPTGIRGSGALTMGNIILDTVFNVNLPDLTQIAFYGKTPKLCINDVLSFFSNFMPKKWSVESKLDKVPNIFCIKNALMSIASAGVEIAGFMIPAGIKVAGTLDFPLLKNYGGKISLHLKKPTIFYALTDMASVSADAILDPINLKFGNNIIFSLNESVKSPDKGPNLYLSIAPFKQDFWIKGHLNLLDGFVDDEVSIIVKDTQMSFSIEKAVGGISETISGTLKFNPAQLTKISQMSESQIEKWLLGRWQIKGALNIEQLNKMVISGLKDVIEGWQKSLSVFGDAQKELLSACDKITGYLKPFIKFNCSQCLKNIGPLGTVDVFAGTFAGWLTDLSKVFQLESVSFDYSLQDLVGIKSPSYTVKYLLFGKEQTITLQFDPADPKKMGEDLLKIIKEAIKPANFKDTLKLIEKMGTGAATNVKNLLDTTLNCSFTTKFIEDEASFDIAFNPLNPDIFTAQATLKQMCLEDLLFLANQFGAGIPSVAFSVLECLQSVTITLSSSEIDMQGTISVLGVEGSVQGKIDKSGIVLNGAMLPINMLSGLFVLSDMVDSSQGPGCVLNLTKETQALTLSGKLTLFNELSRATTVIISPQELSFEMAGNLLGLGVDIVGSAVPAIPLKNMLIEATITTNLNNLILPIVEARAGILNKGVADVFNSINKVFSDIQHKVSSVPGAGSALQAFIGTAQNVVDEAQKSVNLLSTMITNLSSSFGIDKIVLSGDISLFDKNAQNPISVAVTYSLGGNQETTAFTVPFGVADLTTVIVEQIASSVINTIEKLVTQPQNSLNNFKQNMDDLWKEVLKEVADAMANFFKNIGEEVGKDVENLGKDVWRVAKEVYQTANNIVSTVDSAVKDAIKSVDNAATAAEKAATAAADAAATAANKAMKAAEKAADEAAKAADQALDVADKDIKNAISDVKRSVKKFFHHFHL